MTHAPDCSWIISNFGLRQLISNKKNEMLVQNIIKTEYKIVDTFPL